MKTGIARVAVIALAGWPFTPAAASSFQVQVTTQAAAGIMFQGTPGDFHDRTESGVTGPVSASNSAHEDEGPGFDAGDALAAATIDLGYFKGTADSQAKVQPGVVLLSGPQNWVASSTAVVNAQSGDLITIMPASPSLSGTLATVTASVDVSGTFLASASNGNGFSQAMWGMSVGTVGGTFMFGLQGQVDNLNPAMGDGLGLHTLFFDVRLGVPSELTTQYTLQSNASISSSLGVGGHAQGLASFGSTFRWMGITQVTDADGNPIEYSLTSESGFDWTQPAPVPVPPALLSFLSALWGSIALFARRRGGVRP